MTCHFKYGGEGAPVEKVGCDLRPAGGEEAHGADTWGRDVPGRGATGAESEAPAAW